MRVWIKSGQDIVLLRMYLNQVSFTRIHRHWNSISLYLFYYLMTIADTANRTNLSILRERDNGLSHLNLAAQIASCSLKKCYR